MEQKWYSIIQKIEGQDHTSLRDQCSLAFCWAGSVLWRLVDWSHRAMIFCYPALETFGKLFWSWIVIGIIVRINTLQAEMLNKFLIAVIGAIRHHETQMKLLRDIHTSECTGYIKTIATMETKSVSAKFKMTNLETDNKKLNEKNSKAVVEKQRDQKKIKRYDDELESLNKHVYKLENKLHTAQYHLANSDNHQAEKMKPLYARIKELESIKVQQTHKLEEKHSTEIAELQGTKAAIDLELDGANKRIVVINGELDGAKKQIDGLNTELKMTINVKDDQINKLTTKLAKPCQKCTALMTEGREMLNNFTTKYNTLDTECTFWKTKAGELQQAGDVLYNQLQSVIGNLTSCQTGLLTCQQELANTKAELTTTKASEGTLRERFDSREKTIKTCQVNCDTASRAAFHSAFPHGPNPQMPTAGPATMALEAIKSSAKAQHSIEFSVVDVEEAWEDSTEAEKLRSLNKRPLRNHGYNHAQLQNIFEWWLESETCEQPFRLGIKFNKFGSEDSRYYIHGPTNCDKTVWIFQQVNEDKSSTWMSLRVNPPPPSTVESVFEATFPEGFEVHQPPKTDDELYLHGFHAIIKTMEIMKEGTGYRQLEIPTISELKEIFWRPHLKTKLIAMWNGVLGQENLIAEQLALILGIWGFEKEQILRLGHIKPLRLGSDAAEVFGERSEIHPPLWCDCVGEDSSDVAVVWIHYSGGIHNQGRWSGMKPMGSDY